MTIGNGGNTSGGSGSLSVAFSVGISGQSVSTSSLETIEFNQKELDTGTYFNTTTYRFTPLVAGFYYIGASIAFSTIADGSLIHVTINKNGSSVAKGADVVGANHDAAVDCERIIELNGSTDYITAQVFQTSGGNESLSTTYTKMHGFLVYQS